MTTEYQISPDRENSFPPDPARIHFLWQQRALVAAARRAGLETRELPSDGQVYALELIRDKQRKLVVDGCVFPDLPYGVVLLADNKYACKRVLAELGIPTAADLVVEQGDAQAREIEDFLQTHGRAVCKPLVGGWGIGVLMDVSATAQVIEHWRKYPRLLLEQQMSGQDLRIQAVGGRLVAASLRVPARVSGNGRDNIAKLIQQRNAELARFNPANRIEVDEQVHDLLSQAGYGLDSVPPAGVSLQVKKVANISQGGQAVDITDQLHPVYARWVSAIAERLGISLFALDVIAREPGAAPDAQHTALLELNTWPMWLHHTFSEGRSHDIAGLILEDLFGPIESR